MNEIGGGLVLHVQKIRNFLVAETLEKSKVNDFLLTLGKLLHGF
jgi:hypothetical protein